MFGNFFSQKDEALQRLREENFYEQIAKELRGGYKRDGIYAKALVDAEGAEDKAKALYIKLAVQSLKDEIFLIAEYEKELQEKIRVEKQKNDEYKVQ